MKKFLLPVIALLLFTLPGGADTQCIGVGCGGSSSSFSTVSPTFTGTTTVDRLVVVGTEPTCTATGIGTGTAACSFVTVSLDSAGSTASAGTISLQTGDPATPAASGTVTLIFPAALGTNRPVCLATLSNDSGLGVSWATTATIRQGATSSTTSCVWAWSTGGGALTALEIYGISYIVVGK